MLPNSQFLADLVAFTEEILNRKLHTDENCEGAEIYSHNYFPHQQNIVLLHQHRRSKLYDKCGMW